LLEKKFFSVIDLVEFFFGEKNCSKVYEWLGPDSHSCAHYEYKPRKYDVSEVKAIPSGVI
jgi:hypothetical protein